jgi:cell division protein FtsW
MERLNVFFGQNGLNYQISQSLLAIGSGGIFGRGLGNGKQKLLFLPELQNDFIFANIGEECGLIGCVLLLVLFGYILYRGFKIANSSKDEFGYLYTSSVIALLGFQVIVNIGVATSIMPVTGMALPFISAGGTSMVILFMMVGPIVNLSRGMHSGKRRRSGRQRTKRGQK